MKDDSNSSIESRGKGDEKRMTGKNVGERAEKTRDTGWRILKLWIEEVTPQMRIGFFSTLICGVLAHGVALFNKFSWHDDLFFMFSPGSTVSAGRWALHLLSWAEDLFFQDGHFSMPLYNGIMAILFIALAVGLLIRLLNIHSRALSACLGCVMVAYPSITGLFAYEFTIHYYMLALLMIVSAAYLMCREKGWWSWPLAVALGAGTLGIYQAYLSILLALLLLDAIIGLTERGEDFKKMFQRVLKQACCLAAIMAVYFGLNSFFLQKLHLGMIYPANEMGDVSLMDYLGRAGMAYREFFLPSSGVSWDMYPHRLHTMYYILLIGEGLLSVRLIFQTMKRKKGNAAFLLLLLTLVPLGCNFVFVMAEHAHGLMAYGQVMQIVFFVYLADRQDLRLPEWRKAVSVASALVLGGTGLLYVRLANQCYLKFELEQTEAISFFTTLVTQIKSSEDYQADRPVLFRNEMQIMDPTVTEIAELDTIRTFAFQFNTLEYLNNYTWARFMEIWCGFTPVYYAEEDLNHLPEVQAMPHYPDAGSIQLIQDVLVVNF